MKNQFREKEFWKSALMTMPDNSFFELLRSVFGKIKTPFNKQALLNDLETFLLREDIQKTITAYIDETDAKIIAATALFCEPAQSDLENFFADEYSSAKLQDIIVNLEERFILYRFTEEKTTRLALNPVLENLLQPFIADASVLFPAEPEDKSAAAAAKHPAPLPQSEGSIIFNDLTFAALLSFTAQWDLFYRSEGVLRRKVNEAGKACFPGMDLQTAIGSMQVLGIFYIEGNCLLTDKKRLDDFCTLSPQVRSEYYAAAMLVYNETKPHTEILPPLFRNIIRITVSFIHNFVSSLNAGLIYPEITIKRLMEILKTQTDISINCGLLLAALENTGLIMQVKTKEYQLCLEKQESSNDDAITHNAENPVIAIDSGNSILVYPEISFTDAVSLASFLNIRGTGSDNFASNKVICFELEKDSAVRAFDNNITSAEIISLLNRLSGGKTDETLIWNLNDWEKRHKEISLKQGVVLTLAEEHRYLTQTKPLAELISETLSPGVYLLCKNTLDEAAAVLHNAGIDIIARKNERKETGVSAGGYFQKPTARPLQTSLNTAEKFELEDASALTEKFKTILETIPLSKPEKDELAARIERRLVLCETQLKEASIRYEKLEARTMDYIGKQNIAKQAIAQKSPVEIVWQGSRNGKGESIFGIPQSLEKDGSEQILIIIQANEQEPVRIPLAKISLLRRIKKSLFEK